MQKSLNVASRHYKEGAEWGKFRPASKVYAKASLVIIIISNSYYQIRKKREREYLNELQSLISPTFHIKHKIWAYIFSRDSSSLIIWNWMAPFMPKLLAQAHLWFAQRVWWNWPLLSSDRLHLVNIKWNFIKLLIAFLFGDVAQTSDEV